MAEKPGRLAVIGARLHRPRAREHPAWPRHRDQPDPPARAAVARLRSRRARRARRAAARARPRPPPRDHRSTRSRAAGDGVLLDTSAGPLEYDAVLYATGRDPVPNTAEPRACRAGRRRSRRTARCASTGAIAAASPSIYAIGDCSDHAGSGLDAGSFDLTPVAIAEGRAIAETLFNDNPQEVCYETIPTAVFSLPEAAAVGLTEERARAARPRGRWSSAPASGRSCIL